MRSPRVAVSSSHKTQAGIWAKYPYLSSVWSACWEIFLIAPTTKRQTSNTPLKTRCFKDRPLTPKTHESTVHQRNWNPLEPGIHLGFHPILMKNLFQDGFEQIIGELKPWRVGEETAGIDRHRVDGWSDDFVSMRRLKHPNFKPSKS